MKECKSCNTRKLITEFYKDSYSKDLHSTQCKVCRDIRSISYSKERKAKDPIFKKKSQLASCMARRKKLYGVGAKEYQEMLEKQNFSCYTCKTHIKDQKKDMAVDHCHKTQKVRGLLCDSCNRAIGLLKDSVEIAINIAEYLKK